MGSHAVGGWGLAGVTRFSDFPCSKRGGYILTCHLDAWWVGGGRVFKFRCMAGLLGC